jgi:FkbM family methyltransferase
VAGRLNSIVRLFGIQVVKNSRLDRLIEDASLQNHISQTLVRQAKGVLHIGGHYGEEAEVYNALRKPVLWVEGVSDYYKVLIENIGAYPFQKALNYFLSDTHQISAPFYVTNNEGSSSSLLKLNDKNPYKGLEVSKVMTVETFRLTEIISSNEIINYDHWIIDVQGAELRVLKGAREYLKFAKTLVIECSTYDLYATQAHFHQIADYLSDLGFIYIWTMSENSHGDVIFVNTKS